MKNLADWKTEQMFLYRKNEKNVKNLPLFKILAIGLRKLHSYINSSVCKCGGIYVYKGICLCIIYAVACNACCENIHQFLVSSMANRRRKHFPPQQNCRCSSLNLHRTPQFQPFFKKMFPNIIQEKIYQPFLYTDKVTQK